MYAACELRVEAVKFLIEKGADINTRDEDDNVTALSLAKKCNSGNNDKQDEIIQMLVKAGAVE